MAPSLWWPDALPWAPGHPAWPAGAGWHRLPLARLREAATEARCLGALSWPLAEVADVCFAAEPAHAGATGHVRWRSDGTLMLGALDLALVDAVPLAAQAEAAYTDVFAAMRAAGLPRLLRVWNYLPAINDDEAPGAGHVLASGASERYRQFNIGRQAAFLAHGQDAFAGSPAACALGVEGHVLAIRFLAGRVPTQAVDNPRQVPAWRYPTLYGPKAPTFSRASLVELDPGAPTLFVSGTASIVGHASVHAGDVRAQTRETLANLDAVLAQAAQLHAPLAGRCAAELQACIYLRHVADRIAVHEELVRAWGEASVARAVWLRADVCRRELLVEVEGHLDSRAVDGDAP